MSQLFFFAFSSSSFLLGFLSTIIYLLYKRKNSRLFTGYFILNLGVNFFINFLYNTVFYYYLISGNRSFIVNILILQIAFPIVHGIIAIFLIAKNYSKRNVAEAWGYSALCALLIGNINFYGGLFTIPLFLTVFIGLVVYLVSGEKHTKSFAEGLIERGVENVEESEKVRQSFFNQFIFTFLIHLAILFVYGFGFFFWAFGSRSIQDEELVFIDFLAIAHGIVCLVLSVRNFRGNLGATRAHLFFGIVLLFFAISAGLLLLMGYNMRGVDWH